jgi:hypothetical protein
MLKIILIIAYFIVILIRLNQGVIERKILETKYAKHMYSILLLSSLIIVSIHLAIKIVYKDCFDFAISK